MVTVRAQPKAFHTPILFGLTAISADKYVVERKHATFGYALGMFLASALFVAWCAAGRFGFGDIDQGIYLEGGLRIAHGEIPYRDFFAYLAPGTFILQGILFKTLGVSLAVSRVPVIIDVALATSLVFLLLAKLVDRRTAVVLGFCFFAIQTAHPTTLIANHRWDSAACALAAVTFGFFLLEKPCHSLALAAGVCAALATWTTWSFALLCIVLLAWLVCDRTVRPYAATCLAGIAVVSAAAIAWLWLNHALLPMIEGFVWGVRNYSGPNRTAYGWMGRDSPFRNATTAESVLLVPALIPITLPITAPVLSLIGWPFRLRSHPDRGIVFLLLCAGAIVATCWPRPDLLHLLFISPLPYVLSVVLLLRVLPRNLQLALVTGLLLFAVCDLFFIVSRRVQEPSLTTRVGMVHGRPKDLAILRMVQSHVPPEQTLFVFPYFPAFYFTTGARNPTRYSYLQPGMFPKEDEEEVLRALEAHPPDAVVYQHVEPAEYLKVWPSSDPARLRMPEIEDFLRARYRPVAREGTFQILRPVTPPVTQ